MNKLQKWGVVDRQLTPAERWLSFMCIFLAASLAAFNMFKASPAIQYIATDINMPVEMISQIMGSYSIPALLFAYPGMWIAQKLGFKFASLLSAVLMLIGSCICLFVTDPTSFLVGRAAEGVGYGIIAIVGPNSVPRLFPRKQLGLSMGVWSQWITLGTVFAMVFAPILFNMGGGVEVPFSWQVIWIGAIVTEVVLIALVLLFVKMPAVNENEIVDGDVSKKAIVGKNFMAGAIVVSLAFMLFAYINVVAINTMYPSFLQQFKGMSVQASSSFMLISAVLAVPLGIGAGVLADKFRCRKAIVIAGYLLCAFCMYLLWNETESMTGPIAGMILYSLCIAGPATCTRALIPQLVVDPKKTDFALSTMGFLMALGKVLGGYFVSPSIVAFGYTGMAYYTLIPMMLVAAIIVLVFVKSDKFIDKVRAEERKAALDGKGGVDYAILEEAK